jgi:hypothetical protein
MQMIDEKANHKKRRGITALIFKASAFACASCALIAAIILTRTCVEYIWPSYSYYTYRPFHYILQTFGFLCFIHALITYKLYPFVHRTRVVIHVCSHLACISFFAAGIIIRIYAKNKDVTDGKYEANLYSLHSFLAVGALSIYFLQLIIYGYVFGYKNLTARIFSKAIKLHRDVGLFILTAFTTVITTGLQNLFNRTNCTPPPLTHIDLSPYYSYLNMKPQCKQLNAVGVLVYVSSLLASLTISEADRGTLHKTSAPSRILC